MKNDSPCISIVIVTYNNLDTISLCLDSVIPLKRKHNIEIILVDNASTDGTLFEVENSLELDVIHNQANLGYCAANNQGIERSKGQYILLLNPDAILTEGFLPNALESMEIHSDVALLTGKVLLMDNRGQPIQKERHPIIDTVGMKMLRNRQIINIGEGEVDVGQYDHEQYVFAICGAVCLCRRRALQDAMVDNQVFDNVFFAYKEDVDLSWRLRRLGWSCYYTPNAVAYHARYWKPGFNNRRKIDPVRRFNSFKNRRLVIFKNDTIREILPDFLHIFGFELVSFFYALILEPILLRAYWDILNELPRILRWRKAISQKNINS